MSPLRDDDAFSIKTHDGTIHNARPVANGIETNEDLALLEFASNNSYQTATINSAATPGVNQPILAAGYSGDAEKFLTEEGKIKQVSDKIFKDGYSIGYSSNIVQGMSGGAILNIEGELIGINAKSASPIVDTGYVYQDNTHPNAEEIKQLRQLNWGLSIDRLLKQINPELIATYNLPIVDTVNAIENTASTGWLAKLEDKAKQITVRIDINGGENGNGSGVIIAKKGNTYTVLTAAHVICQQPSETTGCVDSNYEIVTSDGHKYSLDPTTFRRDENADLAVLEFTSQQSYQVAELLDSELDDDEAIFVAGFPDLNNSTASDWLFSLGYGLSRGNGLLEVNIDNNSLPENEKFNSYGLKNLPEGYDMVYTNITFGGMSGGAILDRAGRVIGIHGQSDGENNLVDQDNSEVEIQLGYSVGIPVTTFRKLADKFQIASLPSVETIDMTTLTSAEEKDFEAAVLNVSIERGNTSARSWVERGNQLWRLRRKEEAREAFDRAIAMNPEFIHLAYYGKSLCLDDAETVLTNLELAIAAKPNYVRAWRWKSWILSSMGRHDEALSSIDKAIELEGDNSKLHLERAALRNIATPISEREDFLQKATESYEEGGEEAVRQILQQDPNMREVMESLREFGETEQNSPSE